MRVNGMKLAWTQSETFIGFVIYLVAVGACHSVLAGLWP